VQTVIGSNPLTTASMLQIIVVVVTIIIPTLSEQLITEVQSLPMSNLPMKMSHCHHVHSCCLINNISSKICR
jgi:hypothetical protein